MSDSINHPPHYNKHPSGVECIDIVEHMNFCLGNAIKYIWRTGLKDSANQLEDLKKARWYVEREIQRLEKSINRRVNVRTHKDEQDVWLEVGK